MITGPSLRSSCVKIHFGCVILTILSETLKRRISTKLWAGSKNNQSLLGPSIASLIGTSIGSLNDVYDNRPSKNQEIKSDRLKFTQLFHESDCNKTDSACFTQVVWKLIMMIRIVFYKKHVLNPHYATVIYFQLFKAKTL